MKNRNRMIVLRHLVCLALWGAWPAVWAQAADGSLAGINLVRNFSFEKVEKGKPVAWTCVGSAKVDKAEHYAGGTSLLLRRAEKGTTTATQVLRGGERQYLLLAWVKTKGVSGSGARVTVRGPDGRRLAESTPVTGTAPWQCLSLGFNPGNLGRVTIEVSLADAVGSAWFDAVIMVPIEKAPQIPKRFLPRHPPENIALGKPCTLLPSPTYKYCTDPGDNRQLTDGVYTTGYFWTQTSSVGWYLYSPRITLDLGAVQPIDGIMIHVPGGGAAGVKFPADITFLVSDDNKTFHEVARLTPRGLVQDGKNWYGHRFEADGLKTRGRYVMVRLDKAGSTCFADEIEVYKGKHDPRAVVFRTPPLNRADMAFAQFGITPATYTAGHFPVWPHVAWAKPLAGGPIKAILMAFSNRMRQVVEVAERLDLDYTPVQHFSYYRLQPLGELMREQIANALPECEVMVVAGYRWRAMPKDLLENIKTRVRAGMGLVCVEATTEWLDPIRDVLDAEPLPGDQGLWDDVPVTLLPAYHKPHSSPVHLGTCGKGRVAWIRWADFTRPGSSMIPDFRAEDIDDDAIGPLEYSFAALAKTILWAARRDGSRLVGIKATPERIEVRLAPGKNPVTVDVRAHDRYFDGEAPATASVPRTGGTRIFPQTLRRHGTNAVDVWVRDQAGRIVDFGSAAYTVRRRAFIESVTVAQPVFVAGEPLRASITVGGASGEVFLVAHLEDTFGRRVGVASPVSIGPDGGAKVEFRDEHPLTLGTLLYLELWRKQDGKPAARGEMLDRRIVRLWRDLPEKDDFTVCAWYAWDSQPMAFHGLRMLRALGVDTYVSQPAPWRAENAAVVNMRHGPENVERVYPHNKGDSLVRLPCLTDPAYRARTAKRIEAMAEEARPFGVTEWSLGDESTLGRRDYCVSPTCLDSFREYLTSMYGTLDALNESWGSNFGAWDEVVPATREQIQGRSRLGAWLDHRAYMEKLFADYHAWCAGLIVKHIPRARVGISGTPNLNAYSGHDWWQLMQRALTHLSGYGGVQRELQRSFMRPGTFYSTFLGYDYKDSDEQGARHDPWDLLFHGANGINYYTLMSNTLNCPLIRPDGSPTRKAPWFFAEVGELKAGMGKLFMEATRVHHGIAVHYSPPSIHAADAVGLFDAGDALRNYDINLSNVCTILEQCHYQYNFLHADQMAAGALDDYRLLILPWSSCISATEAEAIRRFVRRGGTVLADSYCGVRDEHGKPHAMLDEVFGIEQPLDPPALKPTNAVVDLAKADAALSGTLTVRVASGLESLKLAGGTPVGRIGRGPAMMVHRYGKGRAIFLNFSFSTYAQVWAAGAAGEVLDESQAAEEITTPIRHLMVGMFRLAGIKPPIPHLLGDWRVVDPEVSIFQLDHAWLVGVVGSIGHGPVNPEDIVEASFEFPAPFYVYEARGGTYFGRIRRFHHRAPRGIARVYVALPYRVTALELHGPRRLSRGSLLPATIRIRTDGGKPGTHVIRVTVRGPDGKGGMIERRWYAQNLRADHGRAVAGIPFAYNDAPGEWTIEARDVATGVTGRLSVTIE